MDIQNDTENRVEYMVAMGAKYLTEEIEYPKLLEPGDRCFDENIKYEYEITVYYPSRDGVEYSACFKVPRIDHDDVVRIVGFPNRGLMLLVTLSRYRGLTIFKPCEGLAAASRSV